MQRRIRLMAGTTWQQNHAEEGAQLTYIMLIKNHLITIISNHVCLLLSKYCMLDEASQVLRSIGTWKNSPFFDICVR